MMLILLTYGKVSHENFLKAIFNANSQLFFAPAFTFECQIKK